MGDYYELGRYRRGVTTKSPQAQIWFDRGLLWYYGFNREESVRCFLEQGRVEEAAQVYRADLGLDGTLRRAFQHRNNVWSLHGYVECLHRLGEHAEAASMRKRLDLAAARADVEIGASCFCRVGDSCCG
jgi:hypothetical protein